MVEHKPKIIIEESDFLKLKRKTKKGKVHKPKLENNKYDDTDTNTENVKRYTAERCEEEIEVKGQRIYEGKINIKKVIKNVEYILNIIED